MDPEVQLGKVQTEPAGKEMETLPSACTSQEDLISRRVIRKITVPIQVFLSKKDLCRC